MSNSVSPEILSALLKFGVIDEDTAIAEAERYEREISWYRADWEWWQQVATIAYRTRVSWWQRVKNYWPSRDIEWRMAFYEENGRWS